jgi:outer membrane protein OmpA-like peptidoglycan-associated protein
MARLTRFSSSYCSLERTVQRRLGTVAGLLVLGVVSLAATAQAQSGPVVIGGNSFSSSGGRVLTDPDGSVTVDWGVLDRLGSGPQSNLGLSTLNNGPIVLAPPKPQPRPRVAAAPKAAPAPKTDSMAAIAPTSAAPADDMMTAPPMSGDTSSMANSLADVPPPPAMPQMPPAAPVTSDSTPAAAVARNTQPTPLVPPPPPAVAPPPPATPSVAAPSDAPRAMASIETPTMPISPPSSVVAGSPLSIAFGADSSQLPEDAKGRLDGIVRNMTGNDRLRAQIIAYAAGTSDTASQARRLSLSRALTVRAYLIEKGIASTRLDVRALGYQVEGGSPDRVDISVAAR